MWKKTFSFSLLAAAFIVFGSLFAANGQSVSGSVGNGTVTRGTAARASVVLSIPGGLHVNSHRPSGQYADPTTVRATGRGLRIGAVSYPAGRNRKFEFSETPINVYEGRVVFPFNVTVPAGFTGSSITVRVSVHYQACTNEVCYPPKSKEVTLTARVK